MNHRSCNSFITRILFLLVAIWTISGCATRPLEADLRRECPYMGGIVRETGEKFDPETVARPSPSPILKALELTDEGELADRCQFSDLLYEVKFQSQKAPDKPKLIVIYIHGWKHDGSLDDTDWLAFKNVITTLTQQENTRALTHEVIGVYVAWPGLATNLPIATELSFWGRKRAADRISQAGNITRLIGALNNVRCQRDNPRDFIVGIGHSFGARILYSATSQLLLYELQVQHPGNRGGIYGNIQGPTDLTVLLNPAFEASTYTALDSARRWQESFSIKTQQPVLLTISTTNDWATKVAFPIGQWIGLDWHERQLTTIGNYNDYFTHRLGPVTDNLHQRTNTDLWYDNYCDSGLCLARTDELQPGNPFLVATTDKNVLDGHNGIWKEYFTNWLTGFIRDAEEKQATTGQLRGGCAPTAMRKTK